MSVSSQSSRISYAGNGSTVAFSFPYYFQAKADLVVKTYVVATGVITSLVLTTNYAITGTADPTFGYTAGGTVTLGVAPPTGTAVVIYRAPAAVQSLQFPQSGPFNTQTLEAELDNLTLQSQRFLDKVNRTAALPDGFSDTFDPTLPSTIALAASEGCTIIIDPAGGKLAIGPSAGDVAGAAANAAAAAASASAAASSASSASSSASTATTQASAASTSATAAAASASAASTSASGASTSATAAASSATSASGSATTATTQASAASTSATSASGSATTATTQAGNASTSATAASGSATAAATSATNAAGSATAAATSATNAAASATTAAAYATALTTKGDILVYSTVVTRQPVGTDTYLLQADSAQTTGLKYVQPTSSLVGLGNVTNTSDANKPVSTAQQTALNLKADLASPTFTGTPLAPTASGGTNTTQIATTAFVTAALTAAGVTAAVAPTVQNLTSSSGTYNKSYMFIVTSANATAGATYTNNGITYTVKQTISAGTLLWLTGSNVPTSSGTLTKASGTGDSSITFSAYKAPLYLRVKGAGAGGGGGGAGATGASGGSNGGDSTFGTSFITAGGGLGGNAANNGFGGANGPQLTTSLGTALGSIYPGNGGGAGHATTAGDNGDAGHGGGSALFGGGASAQSRAGTPVAGSPNSGGGGSGGVAGGANSGGGGGSGADCVDVYISSPALTYAYTCGAGGSGGGGGTTGSAGAAGGSGSWRVEEYYQ